MQHGGMTNKYNISTSKCEEKAICGRLRHSHHSPSLFYLLTVGVEVVYFHLLTLRHAPQLVGLRWTTDCPVAETSTSQHKHSQETNIHVPGGIRTHDPSKRSATDLHLRPRSHWDRHLRHRRDKNIKKQMFEHQIQTLPKKNTYLNVSSYYSEQISINWLSCC
jgi:hypothetical protein